jgi:hypothetical protein
MVSSPTYWFGALSICLSEVCLVYIYTQRPAYIPIHGRKINQRTRPTIVFTSEDKELHKDAFKVTKVSGILRDYPGFEADHCPLAAEFEL